MATKLITKDTYADYAYSEKLRMPARVYKNKLTSHSFNAPGAEDRLMDNEVMLKERNYKSPYEMNLNGRAPIADRITRGDFSLHVPSDLYDYIDATRLDVTRRVLAEPTLFPFIYDVQINPNFSRSVTVQELNPLGVKFEAVEGSGDSVPVGSWEGGTTDTVSMGIKAAGFTWDLAFELYNDLFNMQKMNDAVARGYAAKVNDEYLDPIIDGTYTGAKATAASTTGDTWQEKLYNTILNARRDLHDRTDPLSGRPIDVSNTVLLCSKSNAEDIDWVIRGQLNVPADSKNLARIPGVSTILGYDGDSFTVGNETVSYDGVTDGTCYLIAPIPRGFIAPWKRQLTMLTQMQGDILKLEREKRAWYYVNGVYNSFGITNYVQKITLPTIG